VGAFFVCYRIGARNPQVAGLNPTPIYPEGVLRSDFFSSGNQLTARIRTLDTALEKVTLLGPKRSLDHLFAEKAASFTLRCVAIHGCYINALQCRLDQPE